MTQLSIRVVIADDHPVIRLGLQNALEEEPVVRCVGVAGNAGELRELLAAQPCDVLVTDYAMPDAEHSDGQDMLAGLRAAYPELRIVVVTGLDQLALLEALRVVGVQAVVSKADDLRHVTAAVMAVYAGRPYASPAIVALQEQRRPPARKRTLSAREEEVIQLYLQGLTIAGIGAHLGLKKQTVSTQKMNALRKLGVANDAELFTYASELGLRRDPAAD
jgi:two-component system capsular synthesis response regulator RcsB